MTKNKYLAECRIEKISDLVGLLKAQGFDVDELEKAVYEFSRNNLDSDEEEDN